MDRDYFLALQMVGWQIKMEKVSWAGRMKKSREASKERETYFNHSKKRKDMAFLKPSASDIYPYKFKPKRTLQRLSAI